MPSSTTRLALSDRRAIALLIGIAIAAPLAALAVLQIDYVLTYHACADRSRTWVLQPTVIGALFVGALLLIAWRSGQDVLKAPPPRPFLVTFALLSATASLIVAVSFVAGPLFLHPCDF